MSATAPFKIVDERTGTPPLHPGEILREDLLPHFKVSSAELAQHLRVPVQVIDALLSERGRVTKTLASRLGASFGQDAQYWLALQRQYDLWQASIGSSDLVRGDVRRL